MPWPLLNSQSEHRASTERPFERLDTQKQFVQWHCGRFVWMAKCTKPAGRVSELLVSLKLTSVQLRCWHQLGIQLACSLLVVLALYPPSKSKWTLTVLFNSSNPSPGRIAEHRTSWWYSHLWRHSKFGYYAKWEYCDNTIVHRTQFVLDTSADVWILTRSCRDRRCVAVRCEQRSDSGFQADFTRTVLVEQTVRIALWDAWQRS